MNNREKAMRDLVEELGLAPDMVMRDGSHLRADCDERPVFMAAIKASEGWAKRWIEAQFLPYVDSDGNYYDPDGVPESRGENMPSSRCTGCGSYDYVLSAARGSYICAFCRTPCNANTHLSQSKVRPVELSPDTIRQRKVWLR